VEYQSVALLFRIATDTIRKRLMEFQKTPSAQLNLAEFHQSDSNVEYDPPAFICNVLQDNGDDVDIVLDEGDGAFVMSANDLAQDEVYRNALIDEEEEDEEAPGVDGKFVGAVPAGFGKKRKALTTRLAGRQVQVPRPELQAKRCVALKRELLLMPLTV
jgi:hypothetical protein